MCPDQGVNPQPSVVQDDAPTDWATLLGLLPLLAWERNKSRQQGLSFFKSCPYLFCWLHECTFSPWQHNKQCGVTMSGGSSTLSPEASMALETKKALSIYWLMKLNQVIFEFWVLLKPLRIIDFSSLYFLVESCCTDVSSTSLLPSLGWMGCWEEEGNEEMGLVGKSKFPMWLS